MSDLNFPKIGMKENLRPVFTAKDAIRVTDRDKLGKMPKKALLIYSSALEDRLRNDLSLARYNLPFESPFYHYINPSVYIDKNHSLLFIRITIGAPVTAIMADDLIAVGVRSIILAGTAGGLGRNISVGDVCICTSALRDEGTSHHYLKHSMFVDSDKELNDSMEKGMMELGIGFKKGPTWSTDAVYVESKEEIKKYAEMGVLTVDMEAAALFAVAKIRQIKASAVFVVSDLLNGQEWSGMKEHEIEEGFSNLARIASIYSKL